MRPPLPPLMVEGAREDLTLSYLMVEGGEGDEDGDDDHQAQDLSHGPQRVQLNYPVKLEVRKIMLFFNYNNIPKVTLF